MYTLQPYKKSIHNTFESALIFILAAFYVSHGAITVSEFASTGEYFILSVCLTFTLAVLPIVISVSYAVW